jgi:hypothetical protein
MEGPEADSIVREELVTGGVQVDIGSIVWPQRADRGLPQRDDRLVGGVGSELFPLGLQVEQGQPQRERVQRRLAIVHEQEHAPHDSTRVHHDVVEPHLVRAFQHSGRRDATRGAVGELGHRHDAGRIPKNVVELERPGATGTSR